MKLAKAVSVLTVLLGLSIIGQAQNFMTNGLVAYYPFNGNANDESGNGNTGIVTGAKLGQDRFGKGNSAYQFDGSSYIRVPNSSSLSAPSNSVTISVWMRQTGWYITGANGHSPVLAKVYASFDFMAANQYDLEFRRVASGGALFLHPAINPDFAVQLPNFDNTFLDHWVHVVETVTSLKTSLFINGILVSTQLPTATIIPNSADLFIGHTLYGYAQYFLGDIDDVRIYNRALSDQEVKALYGYESQPQPQAPHPATATAQVVNGFVVGLTITDPGYGYSNAPIVQIQGGGGSGAEGLATVANGVVSNLQITSTGSGYTNAPEVIISSPHPSIPHQATGTAQIVNGFVVGITITDPGYGYTNAPAVLIEGGGGSGATAITTVTNGMVSSIQITGTGMGFTNAPEVIIASPPHMPWTDIKVTQVETTHHVVLGHKYVVESSTDLVNWTLIGSPFTANKETITQTFDVASTGRCFRIREVQ